MAKKGLKIFGIGVGSLIIVVGTIVGILIATGVIKTKQDPDLPSSNSDVETPDPLGPGAPNPNKKIQIKTILSNPKISYENRGNGEVPVGLSFNVRYEPSPTIMNWRLNKTLRITFKSGQMKTVSTSSLGTVTMDSVFWENNSEVPVKLELTAHLTYNNDYGNTIAGPESDTLTVNIPN
jgi:hypothetical protein